MKKAILILLTVLLAVSCSQVVYDNLPLEDIDGRKTILTVEQVEDTRNLLLKFKPVPYVTEYAYSINGALEETFEADGAEDGMLSYHIPDSDIPVNKGSVSLFGRTNKTGSWSNLATADFEIILDGIAPDVYLYARYSDKAEIKTESTDPSIFYMVDIRNEDEVTVATKTGPAENGIITIENLNPDNKYSFNVYQMVSSSAGVPEAYTTINVDTFGPEVNMKLSKTENGFEVTSIPSSVSSIKLVKDIKDNSSFSVSQAVNGDTAVISFEEFPSLEYGIFYAITDDETCVSNNLRTATPLTPIENGRIVNYKSVDYTVRLSSEVNLEDVTFTLPGTTGLQITKKSGTGDNTAVITISNLDSNTEYNDLSIRATVDEDFAVTTQLAPFKTQSFAGKFFEWRGTFSNNSEKQNFIIYVDSAPEGSDYPYYVYFAKNDKAIDQSQNYEESSYRIMPLIDNSTGLGEKADSEITGAINWDTNLDSAGVAFTSQNSAYKKNSAKWNTMKNINPSTWNTEKPKFDGNDKVEVKTNSNAPFVGNVETDTRFEFCETDSGEPYISFYNASSNNSLADAFIAKRGTTEFPNLGGSPSNTSTFWLGLVEKAGEESEI